jgi:hypothetical protein
MRAASRRAMKVQIYLVLEEGWINLTKNKKI